jgi:hypothetical protein
VCVCVCVCVCLCVGKKEKRGEGESDVRLFYLFVMIGVWAGAEGCLKYSKSGEASGFPAGTGTSYTSFSEQWRVAVWAGAE